MCIRDRISTQSFHFEVLDNVFAKRYAKFLMDNIHESKEFYFMGDQRTAIKSEIDKIINS